MSFLTKGEKESLHKWGKKLKELGFIKRFFVAPPTCIAKCRYDEDEECFLREVKRTAALFEADTILFVDDKTTLETSSNVFWRLDFTVVGMWVVPAHHVISHSLYQGVLVDAKTGFVYFSDEEKDEYHNVRPYMFSNPDSVRFVTRVEALDKLGESLYRYVKEHKESDYVYNSR